MSVRTQLMRFAVSGGTAVAIDYAVYMLLSLWWMGFMQYPAKGISFIAGSVAAYFMNKLWTFQKTGYSKQEVLRFVCIYGISFGLNVLVHYLVLRYAQSHWALWAWLDKTLAFLAATAVSSTTNFLGMKLWVFRKGSPEAQPIQDTTAYDV
jgi:putative flippase GtrA